MEEQKSDSGGSEIEDYMGELIRMESGLVGSQEQASVFIVAKIKDKEVKLLADTGASRSICGEKIAEELRLEPDGFQTQFKGIKGTTTAKRHKAVTVQIGQRAVGIRFYVIDDGNTLPPLLGLEDMRRMRVMPCPVRMQLIDCDTNLRVDQIAAAAIEGMEKAEEVADTKAILEDQIKHLSQQRREEIMKIFYSHTQCWKEPRIGGITSSQAHITVQGRPIKSQIRRLVPELKFELERELSKLLEAGAIRPSKSEWGSPPVFVRKKDGSWRLCIDYREVNKRMKSDAYPLPLIWDQLQLMAGRLHYTCLDCQSGFWQLPLDEESKEYTAIITHKGTFEFNVMPFGIRTSGAEFQRVMDAIMGDLLQKGVMCYVDDIVIYAQTTREHDELLEEVLKRLAAHGVSIKMSEAEIDHPEVAVLGHLVGFSGIKASPKKVQGILDAQKPKDKAVLKSFLGTISYLRRFIPNLASIIEPLSRLMKKGAKWQWTEEQSTLR